MTIVRLERVHLLIAVRSCSRSIYFYENDNSKATVSNSLCSPVGAIVGRALDLHTWIGDADTVCRRAVAGGSTNMLGMWNTDTYSLHRQRCADDFTSGVQPLLVVERLFQRAIAQGHSVSQLALTFAFDEVDELLRRHAGCIDIDIGELTPRYVGEVVR